MTESSNKPNVELGIVSLSVWSLRYALRRWADLLVVVFSILAKAALEVLKPWPMTFLIDRVLSGKTRPVFEQIVNLLPGAHTANQLILWSVAGTVLIFL